MDGTHRFLHVTAAATAADADGMQGEAPTIRRLPASASSAIRAAPVLVSASSCAGELIANSLDAGATVVSLVLDATSMRLTVRDDGRGMCREDLALIGQQHVSSKGPSQSNDPAQAGANSQHTHGWRGEALSAMALLCRLDIETRLRGSESAQPSEARESVRPPPTKRPRLEDITSQAFRLLPTVAASAPALMRSATLVKCIRHGVQETFEFSTTHREAPGTTISVDEFYATMPVRRQVMLQDKERGREVERMKRVIMRLALIHPQVEFSFYDATLTANGAGNSSPHHTARDITRTSSPHLPLLPWQRIWFKPRTDSLLTNFNLARNLSTGGGGSPSVGASSPWISSSEMPQHLFELSQFQAPCAFSAARDFMSSLRVSGFLSHPTRLQLHHREFQLVYVNRHWVTYKPLSVALDAMYERLAKVVQAQGTTSSPNVDLEAESPIPTANQSPGGHALQRGSIKQKSGVASPSAKQGRRRFPAYLLHLELPSRHYDLLFDPEKTTIEFTSVWSITEGLVSGLEKWLTKQMTEPQQTRRSIESMRSPLITSWASPSTERMTRPPPRTPESPCFSASPSIPRVTPSRTPQSAGRPPPSPLLIPRSPAPRSIVTSSRVPTFTSPSAPSLRSVGSPLPSSVIHAVQLSRDSLQHFQLIGQLDNKVILARVGDALLAVDQHAADERRRLEYLQRNVGKYVASHQLAQPMPLAITSAEALLLHTHRRELNAWGYQYRLANAESGSPWSSSSRLLLLSVPLVCGVELDVNDLREYLQQLKDTPPLMPLPSVAQGEASASSSRLLLGRTPLPAQRILNYKSCRSSVMFGDPLDTRTMQSILHGLVRCDYPYNCAHGRPTMAPLVHVKGWTQQPSTTDEAEPVGGWSSEQLATLMQVLSHPT